jgi:hypothetical protein
MRVRALCVVAVIAVPSAGAGAALALRAQRLDAAFRDGVAPSIADGSAQRALDAARARWRNAGPRSYSYRARVSCFCTVESVRPHTFVVRDRKPRHPAKHFKELATAARLFKLVQHSIDDRPDGLTVKYYENGLLKELGVDRSSTTSDDEVTYFVDRFSSP